MGRNWPGRKSPGFSPFIFQPSNKTDGPKVDKNLFYRTHDVYNGMYKCKPKVSLIPGPVNMTDGVIIQCKFSEPVEQLVVETETTLNGCTALLACGHSEQSKMYPGIGTKIYCTLCSQREGYLGFEHEWSHKFGRTNFVANQHFTGLFAHEYSEMSKGKVSQQEIEPFVHMVLNGFDDIRCNSLEEKIYPGTAQEIEARWIRILNRRGVGATKDNFINFFFATALGTPTDPDGKFEPTKDIVDWASQRVKYKGYLNMLAIVKVAMDRCMGLLLQDIQQGGDFAGKGGGGGQASASATSSGPNPGEGDPGDEKGEDGQPKETQENDNPGEKKGDEGATAEGAEEDGDGGVSDPVEHEQQGNPLARAPRPQDVNQDPNDIQRALYTLIQGATPFDPQEEYHQATDKEMTMDPSSQLNRSMVTKAIELSNLSPDEVDAAVPEGAVDPEVEATIEQAHNNIVQVTKASQLTADARAKLLLIDCNPNGGQIKLQEEELYAVRRIRALFFRAMGREKAKMDSSGLQIDPQALVQYLIQGGLEDDDEGTGFTPDDNIFENDSVRQGFAYHVLTDMSGSMMTLFPKVCRAVEMLKQSLKFPFVTGDMWGFRGGERTPGRWSNQGEVWIYRYARDCKGYEGTAQVPVKNGFATVPVCCGGLTPMHAAIRLAVRHQLTQVPAGMVKKLFLLTDGSPVFTKTQGSDPFPDWLLRQYVEKEVRYARSKGVQVYTLIIGGGITEEHALKMFGARKYWKMTSGDYDPSEEDTVDKVLYKLVRDNFMRYLKHRG